MLEFLGQGKLGTTSLRKRALPKTSRGGRGSAIRNGTMAKNKQTEKTEISSNRRSRTHVKSMYISSISLQPHLAFLLCEIRPAFAGTGRQQIGKEQCHNNWPSPQLPPSPT